MMTFSALRSFTLESGRDEISRLASLRKERNLLSTDSFVSSNRRDSTESFLSPNLTYPRAPSLSNVPEEEATFAIGSDEEDTDEDHTVPTPAVSTPTEPFSRASSVASDCGDAVPVQLQGISEKARGKRPGKSEI